MNNAKEITSSSDAPQFRYEDELIDVFVVENARDGWVDRDAFVELKAACKLMAPLVHLRHFSPAMLWANTVTSHRLTKNNKNYVHAFSLCKYLANYNMGERAHPSQYYTLKRLLGDLLVGGQNEPAPGPTDESLNDIKSRLCSLQECLVSSQSPVYQSAANPLDESSMNATMESLRDLVATMRSDAAAMYADLSSAIESVKSAQQDITNKMAFSNDTMLDGIKSIKDIILRNKKHQHLSQQQ